MAENRITHVSNIPVPRGRKLLNSSLEFVIQQNRAYSAFSIAMTFSFKTGKTRILIFRVETLLLSELFVYLRSISPQVHKPKVVVVIAIELQAQGLSFTIKNCQDRIHAIETATGTRQFNFPYKRKGTSTQD